MSDWQQLAAWTVAPQPRRFAGHFPGHEVVPGAYLLDEVLLRLERKYGALHTVVQAKFARPMAPATAVCLLAAQRQERLHFRLLAADAAPGAEFCTGVVLL